MADISKDTPKQDVYLVVSKNQNTKFWLEKLFSNKINTLYYIEDGEVKFYQQGHLQYIGMNITYGHTVAHFENKKLVWLEAYKVNKETMQLELLPDYQDGVTAIQMDIKITGLTREIIAEAIAQAHKGRLHILGEMEKTVRMLA